MMEKFILAFLFVFIIVYAIITIAHNRITHENQEFILKKIEKLEKKINLINQEDESK